MVHTGTRKCAPPRRHKKVSPNRKAKGGFATHTHGDSCPNECYEEREAKCHRIPRMYDRRLGEPRFPPPRVFSKSTALASKTALGKAHHMELWAFFGRVPWGIFPFFFPWNLDNPNGNKVPTQVNFKILWESVLSLLASSTEERAVHVARGSLWTVPTRAGNTPADGVRL
jgi:hypothetical protein